MRIELNNVEARVIGSLIEKSLVEQKPSLEVRVLSWDFAMVYVLERELLPAYRFGWQNSDRLHSL